MNKSYLFLFISLISALFANAQTKQNSDMGIGNKYLPKFNIGVSYGKDWDNSISDTYSAKIAYEVLRKQQLSIIASARYILSEASFSEAYVSHNHNPADINMNGSHDMGQVGITAIFKTKLFNRPFVGTAVVNTDWGAGGFARFYSIVAGMVMLRSDKDTQFGIGPLFLINSNGKLPALIAFIYMHRFNEKWRINLSGGLFAMEYSPSKRYMLSMGCDVDAKSFYFQPKTKELPNKLKYMTVDFRPLIINSFNITKGLKLDIKAGATLNIVNRVNGMTGTKKYLQFHHKKPHPFVQSGATYSF